jgi:hypothetical protein
MNQLFFVRAIGRHCNNYIFEDLGHSWGAPSKNCLGAVFKSGFNGSIRHLLMRETLHIQGFNTDMAFQGKWTSFPKKRCLKVDKAPPETLDLRKNCPQ